MPEKDIRFTVYIPSHNYGKYLPHAVESVLSQSVKDWELLLIDDGSSDNTPEVMSLYKGDPRIRVYRTEGIGLHKVCNLALKEAKGRYIIRLDGDDLFDENILLVLGNYLDRDSELALVFPDYHVMDEFGEVYATERRAKMYEETHSFDIPAHGACTMVRKEVLEQIGGYSETLKAQDGYYLWTKLIHEHKCHNVNLPLFYYRQHGSNLTSRSHAILDARRQIKKETSLLTLDTFRPFIGVIPCRRHYDFRDNLWRTRFGGKTLLQRKLELCLESTLLDHIVVTSDTDEVLECLGKYDDPRLLFEPRTREETIRSRSIVHTLKHIANKYDPDRTGVTVLNYLQTPFIDVDLLEEAISTLVLTDSDSAVAVEQLRRPVLRRTPFGFERLNPSKGLITDFDPLYQEADAVIASRNRNFWSGTLLGSKVVNFEVPSDKVYFINSEQSLRIAAVMDAQRRVLSGCDHEKIGTDLIEASIDKELS